MSLPSWQKDVLTAHEDSNYSFAFVPNLASFFCLLVFFHFVCFVLFPEKSSQTLDYRNNLGMLENPLEQGCAGRSGRFSQ